MTCKLCGKNLLSEQFTFDGMGNMICQHCFLQGNKDLGESLEDDEGALV